MIACRDTEPGVAVEDLRVTAGDCDVGQRSDREAGTHGRAAVGGYDRFRAVDEVGAEVAGFLPHSDRVASSVIIFCRWNHRREMIASTAFEAPVAGRISSPSMTSRQMVAACRWRPTSRRRPAATGSRSTMLEFPLSGCANAELREVPPGRDRAPLLMFETSCRIHSGIQNACTSSITQNMP